MTRLWRSPSPSRSRTGAQLLDLRKHHSGSGIQDRRREQLFLRSNRETNLAQCGPYYISEWTRGSKVVLKKNPNYWDADNIKLDEIDMVLAEDENTRQQLFDQGQIDLLRNVRTEYIESGSVQD